MMKLSEEDQESEEEEDESEDDKDLVRLICLFMCITLFFTTKRSIQLD